MDPLAGKPAPADRLVDVPRLVTAYYTLQPDPAIAAQRVSFGTSGHRGSSFAAGFNENHVLAVTQAICAYRRQRGIDGPLFIGFDTHALSAPAFASALEVLAANGVQVLTAADDEYTPTPAVSHAILTYNRGRSTGLADGIVITPSHNPPDSGGFKYNPPDGGPADTEVTGGIESQANGLLEAGLKGVARMDFAKARRAAHAYDYLGSYVADLGKVIDLDLIRGAGVRMGVDPLGGAGVHYWARIADAYKLDLRVVNDAVDPTFRFMTLDWDGKIRMDPSSPYAMQRLIALKDSLRRRLRLRYGSRPPRHRHQERRADAAQSLPVGDGGLSVSAACTVATGHRGRQNRGEQRHDRSSCRAARPAPLRGSGGLQVVRRGPRDGRARIRRRGERGRILSMPGRRCLEHGQGRHHSRAPGGGDHGTYRPRSREKRIAG